MRRRREQEKGDKRLEWKTLKKNPATITILLAKKKKPDNHSKGQRKEKTNAKENNAVLLFQEALVGGSRTPPLSPP